MEIRHERTNTVYRVLIYTDVLLEDFIFNNPNCICSSKNKWMVMYHNIEYSMKMSTAKGTLKPGIIILFFTKITSIEYFNPEFERLFGAIPIPSNITLINMVEKYYTPCRDIYFDGVYDALDGDNDIMVVMHKKKKSSTIPKVLKYSLQEKLNVDDGYDSGDVATQHDTNPPNDTGDDPQLSMDLQRFCALKIRPFPLESKVTIEVFDSGTLNVAGINNDVIFSKVTSYINTKLLPILIANSNI